MITFLAASLGNQRWNQLKPQSSGEHPHVLHNIHHIVETNLLFFQGILHGHDTFVLTGFSRWFSRATSCVMMFPTFKIHSKQIHKILFLTLYIQMCKQYMHYMYTCFRTISWTSLHNMTKSNKHHVFSRRVWMDPSSFRFSIPITRVIPAINVSIQCALDIWNHRIYHQCAPDSFSLNNAWPCIRKI